MNDNIKAGGDIHAGDGGYSIGTQEKYDEFVKGRNQSLGKMRIKELKEQAMEWVPNIVDPDTKIRLLNAEKFAELIVRECAEIALEQKKWVEDMKVHNPHDEVWNKARIQQSQHIVDQIEKHFGVEE